MLGILYHSLFSIFTIYVLIESIHYGLFEINNKKNKFGGIIVISFALFCIIFSNIVVWIN